MNARLFSRSWMVFLGICVLHAIDHGSPSKITASEDREGNTREASQSKSLDKDESRASASDRAHRCSRQVNPRFGPLTQDSDFEFFAPLETPVAKEMIFDRRRVLFDPSSRGNAPGTARSLPIWSFFTNSSKFNDIFDSDGDNILQRFLTYLRSLAERKNEFFGYNVGRKSANLVSPRKSHYDSELDIATMHYTSNVTHRAMVETNNKTLNYSLRGGSTPLLRIPKGNSMTPRNDNAKEIHDPNSIKVDPGWKDQRIVVEEGTNKQVLSNVRSNNGAKEINDPNSIKVDPGSKDQRIVVEKGTNKQVLRNVRSNNGAKVINDPNSIKVDLGSKDQKIVIEKGTNKQVLRNVRSNTKVLPENLEETEPEKIVASEQQSRETQVREALELEDMAKITSTELSRYKTVTVEVSSGTSLTVSPGTVARIIFEITNNHDLTVRHYFQARSTTFSVAYLQPQNVWIQPGQSESVSVDVLVPSGTSESTVDTVTLYVQGVESVEKSTYLYVRSSSSTITDYNKPTISHSFNNNCAGNLASSTCANSQWSAEITIRDSDSGLQRVVSSPKGILATRSFVSGTKSSVSFTYSSTCCYTTVVVTATDVFGNYNSRTIDVTAWDNLSQGEIAAITLGALFILFLLILIILAIVCCIRRRKSLDLTFTQRYGSRQPPRAEQGRAST